MEQHPQKLLDQAGTELCRSVRDAVRLKHYSIRTEEAYAGWTTRFILFHGKRHPQEMGAVLIILSGSHHYERFSPSGWRRRWRYRRPDRTLIEKPVFFLRKQVSIT